LDEKEDGEPGHCCRKVRIIGELSMASNNLLIYIYLFVALGINPPCSIIFKIHIPCTRIDILVTSARYADCWTYYAYY
jgi:hypothetical protein